MAVGLDDVAERAQRAVDRRAVDRRIPDVRQHRIAELLDGRQRLVLGELEAAGIDQQPMRQHLVVVEQDEVAGIAAVIGIADQRGQVADTDRGDQRADEGVVNAPHRRAHVEHRLLHRRAPEQLAPEGTARGLQVAEALQPARQVGQLDGVAADRAVGTAHRTMKLQVERAEGGDRHRRRPLHHDRQRLAHGDREFDIDPAGGHQGGQQFELLGDGIELVLDRRHLAVDDAGGAVDQQAFGGTGGAGQHHDVGDARDQRQRGERQSQGRDQRKAEGTARGRRHSTRRRIGTRRYGGGRVWLR